MLEELVCVTRLVNHLLTLFSFQVAMIQLAYCCLFGSFPFNSFLAGFLSAVGMFVLTVCLRIQMGSQSEKGAPNKLSKNRAFLEWLVCQVVLHFVVINFIG
mmetsp:Transcript_14847/g.29808  ORF Transcript_14847/g.29808 Transcript_14847/m.29808 type:complete len:101 (+) Transcript_14847:287-589(+)